VPAQCYGYSTEPEKEIETLSAKADSMKRALDQINRRIEELHKDSSE